jgi:Flp pilus assembly protein TadD
MTRLIPERRMLPRWRPSSEAAGPSAQPAIRLPSPGERPRAALQRVEPVEVSLAHLESELQEWQQRRDVGSAADILSFAVFPETHARLRDIASFLDDQPFIQENKSLKSLVDSVLGRVDAELLITNGRSSPIAAVRTLRRRLSTYPHNPIALMDLALAHTSLGNRVNAERALLAARSLAPENRQTLLAIARYFVHVGEEDRAQRYLERAARTATDPWLMSALIAVGQITGKTPRIVSKAQRLVRAGTIAPAHLSELAGSLATLELESGDRREARRMFDLAIAAPTENVLAQLRWAHQSINRPFEMRPGWAQTPKAFELLTLDAFESGEATTAVDWSLKWQADEPFSSRPAILASYALSLLGKDEKAAELARDGLVTNPEDETLEQNLIFSLIRLGDLAEAEVRLQRMYRRSPSPMVIANIGCLLLAEGNAEGRLFYERAIEELRAKGWQERELLAIGFYADALRRAGQDDWRVQFERAQQFSKGVASPAFAMLVRKIQGNAQLPDATPLAPPTGRRMPKWHWDEKTNTVILRKPRLL